MTDRERQAVARLWLATEWVERLQLPDDAPDDGYLLHGDVRIYAREIRAVRDARADVLALAP